MKIAVNLSEDFVAETGFMYSPRFKNELNVAGDVWIGIHHLFQKGRISPDFTFETDWPCRNGWTPVQLFHGTGV